MSVGSPYRKWMSDVSWCIATVEIVQMTPASAADSAAASCVLFGHRSIEPCSPAKYSQGLITGLDGSSHRVWSVSVGADSIQ